MSRKYYLNETGEEVQQALTEVRTRTVYDDATQIQHGLMAANDKRKLDQVEIDEAISITEIWDIIKNDM